MGGVTRHHCGLAPRPASAADAALAFRAGGWCGTYVTQEVHDRLHPEPTGASFDCRMVRHPLWTRGAASLVELLYPLGNTRSDRSLVFHPALYLHRYLEAVQDIARDAATQKGSGIHSLRSRIAWNPVVN